MEQAYRLQLSAPPVDGKANEACVAFLAELAGVAKSQVRIVTGLHTRIKVVQVDGVEQEEMVRRLNGLLASNDPQ
jgi:uncharacterized protein YggU (UPF0235/DUF167 family)